MRRSVVVGRLFLVLAVTLSACRGKSREILLGDDSRHHPGGTSGASTGGSSGQDGGAGAGEGGAPSVPLDWDSACERAPDAICEKLEECAPLTEALRLLPDCRAFRSALCSDVARLDDTALTPESYLACFERTKALSCDDFLYNGVEPSECDFVGTRPLGSACGNDAQCQSGNCSAGFDSCGTCEPLAGEGEDCAGVLCRAGLVCSADRVCVARRWLGERCDANTSCSANTFCSSGRCARPPGQGGPCMTGGPNCDIFQGVLCNPQTDRCEYGTVPGEGEPCTETCVDGSYCGASTPPVCVAYREEGQACDASELLCDFPLRCTDGSCTRLDPATCN